MTPPDVKDYDAIAGNSPTTWARDCDLVTWGLIAAFNIDQLLGGIPIAHDRPAIHILEGQQWFIS